MYEVDSTVGVCTCPAGLSGRCCKHQIAVHKWFNETLPNTPPVTDEARHTAAKLALGEQALPVSLYSNRTKPIWTEAQVLAAAHSQSHLWQPTAVSAPESVPNNSVNQLGATEELVYNDNSAAQKWKHISASITTILEQHHGESERDDNVMQGLAKIEQRIKHVHTQSQLATFRN